MSKVLLSGPAEHQRRTRTMLVLPDHSDTGMSVKQNSRNSLQPVQEIINSIYFSLTIYSLLLSGLKYRTRITINMEYFT